jgi:hypothetical protein
LIPGWHGPEYTKVTEGPKIRGITREITLHENLSEIKGTASGAFKAMTTRFMGNIEEENYEPLC